MVKPIVLLAAVGGAFVIANAATVPVRIVGVTSTQAILAYDAPDDSACSVIVIDAAGKTAHDTDATLFAGADSDLRTGNLVNGMSRIVVVGQRKSDLAADGKMYSRALQSDAAYAFQVSCDGGSSAGSINFRTRTIPLGNSAPDPFPFNRAGYGNYGYPTVDFSDTRKTYIDPQTGILLKRLTTPGYGSPGQHVLLAPLYAYDLSGTWSNSQSVLADDGRYANYSGSGGPSSALFIPTPTAEGQRAYMDYSENYVDDMLARLKGYGDQVNAIDRTMNACITLDAGQTCTGSTISLALPPSNATEVTGPSSYPSPFFAGWGSPNIPVDSMAADFAGNSRSVSVSHTLVTNTTPLLLGTYQYAFPGNLQSGEHIHIAGSAPTCANNDCTITGGIDATHLSIQQDLGSWFAGAQSTLTAGISAGATSLTVAGTSGFVKNFYGYPIYAMTIDSDAVQCTSLSGATFSGCSGINSNHLAGAAVSSRSFILTNFGLKIWKQTGVGTVYLDSVKYDYASSADYTVGYEGQGLVCSGSVTADYAADGITPLSKPATGSICILSDIWGNPFLYFFDRTSGELRPIARLSSSGVAQDSSNPLSFYQYDASSHNILGCAYDVAGGKFRSMPLDYSAATNPYLTCTENLTAGGGNDVVSQIKHGYPQIDMNYWGQPQFSSVLGGIATFQMRPTQNALAWACFFDMRKPAGQQLLYCSDTWSHYPLRWGGMHGGFDNRTADGWMTFSLMSSLESPNETGVGQYTMQVNQIYNDAGLTSLSSSFVDPLTCEQLGVNDSRWLSQGATGRNCIRVNVKTEPVDTNPSQQDLASNASLGSRPVGWSHNAISCGGDGTTSNCWSYLQPIAEGDWLRDLSDPGGDSGAERFLVAKKTVLGDGSIDLVLSRAASAAPASLCPGAKTSHASGFTLMVDLPLGCAGNEYWIQASDPAHTIYADNPVPYGAHTNLQYDSALGSFTQWTPYAYGLGGNVPGQYGFGYGVRSGQLPSFFSKQYGFGIEMGYAFSGSMTGIDSVQTHPGSLLAYDGAGNRTISGLDARPLGGAAGGDPLAWYDTLTPVSGTQHVYKISLPLQTPGGQPLPNAGLDRKRRAVAGWYGHTLLKDISGPGSQITDAAADSFCIADFAGECVGGSQKGDQFVSVANADTSGECAIWYVRNTPCLASLPNEVARYVQYDVSRPDPTGMRWRVLTSLWGGPGRTNNYANIHGTDGTGWVLGVGKWVNGVRSEIFGAQLPPWQIDSQYRGDFIKVPVTLGGRSGDSVRIRFGYDTNLYCTTRQEGCSTGARNGDAFAWLSEPVTWQSCATGCTVTVPAISGRVLYYVIDRKDAAGTTVSSGVKALAVN